MLISVRTCLISESSLSKQKWEYINYKNCKILKYLNSSLVTIFNSLKIDNNSTSIILNYFVILLVIFTFHKIFKKTTYYFWNPQSGNSRHMVNFKHNIILYYIFMRFYTSVLLILCIMCVYLLQFFIVTVFAL